MEQESSVKPPVTFSKLIPIIGDVVVAALAAGGGVYAYEKILNNTTQATLKSQIESLKMQVLAKHTLTASPIPTTSLLATASPTSVDPTANWKTYTDTNTGLSFK